jgi:hypothetical protein
MQTQQRSVSLCGAPIASDSGRRSGSGHSNPSGQFCHVAAAGG